MNTTRQNTQGKQFDLLLSLFIGAVIGISILNLLLSDIRGEIKFEDLALGKENTTSLATINGVSIHCHDLIDAHNCIDGYRDLHSNMNVVLWLGNSQVHAINQKRQGDETAAPIIYRYLKSNSKYFMTFSQPNANLQEHYLLFEYLTNHVPIQSLVLPVVFDDMRETGIRSSLLKAFKNPSLIKRLEKTLIGRSFIANQGDHDMAGNDMAGNDMAALEDTAQEKSEEYLNNKLSSLWQVWADRPKLRGKIMISLYKFRNRLFGINPSSVRRMIPGRYFKNRQAIEAILKSANEQNIAVLLYIVPLRDDVKIPYNLEQYNDFKVDIRTIAQKYSANFINLEHLVPADQWGTKGSTTAEGGQEIDFMHFQARGHLLLADALYDELTVLMNNE